MMDVWLQALAVFIFHNQGWQDVWPVAALLILLWLVAVFVYVALFEPLRPPPRFFGTRRRGIWVHFSYEPDDYVIRALPWKWGRR